MLKVMLRVLATCIVAAGAVLRPQAASPPPAPQPPRCVEGGSMPRGPMAGATLAARVNVRSGPSTLDAVLFQLGALQTVTVQERGACSDAGECWHRIDAGPGRQGWVSGGLLQPGFSVEELLRMRALAPAMLFDVRRSLAPVADDGRCPSRAYLEPIVEISQRLAAPPPGVDAASGAPLPEGLQRFRRTYFQPGRRYRLLGRPAEASVTIVKRMDLSCVSVGACGRLEGAGAATGHLLATDSPRLAAPAARALSAEESKRAAALARARFRVHGLRASLAQGSPLELYEGMAADLDSDGASELIVAAGFTSPRVAEGAMPDCAAKAALVVDGRTGDVQELMTSAGDAEMGTETPEIVGFVDVDGDGVHEILLRLVGYEWWHYHLFRRVDGRWLEVYGGGGGGC